LGRHYLDSRACLLNAMSNGHFVSSDMSLRIVRVSDKVSVHRHAADSLVSLIWC
jgi:hypothetical protein